LFIFFPNKKNEMVYLIYYTQRCKMTHSATAQIIADIISGYNTELIEYVSRSRIVNHGITGVPYVKKYYNIHPCSHVITFYEYYFHPDDYDFVYK